MADGTAAPQVDLAPGTVRQVAAAADFRAALASRDAGGLRVFETRLLQAARENREPGVKLRRLLPPPIPGARLSGRPG